MGVRVGGETAARTSLEMSDPHDNRNDPPGGKKALPKMPKLPPHPATLPPQYWQQQAPVGGGGNEMRLSQHQQVSITI